MMEGKSFQSECQLLGSMFLDPDIVPTVRETVRDTSYFESPENRIIFDLLIGLHSEGVRPDLIILRNRLEQNHQLKAVGGVDYLVKVVESTATPANYAHHAKHVRECYLERRLLGLKDSIRQAESKPGSVGEKVGIVRAELETIQKEINSRPADSGDGVGRLIADTLAGRRQVLKSPWPLMDGLTRCLMPGTLTLLCGNPGASKSFMLLQLVAHLIETGFYASVLELEESPEFHAVRALAQRSGIADLTDPDWMQAHPDATWSAYNENKDFVAFMSAAITAPDSQLTFQQVVGWIRDKARAGCKFIGIDPVTAVQTTRRDVWAEHNDFLQSVKQIAVEHNTALLFVTHPVKAVSMPDLNQLAGSAAFGRFCQSALWLEHIESKTGDVKTTMGTVETEYNRILHILKSRNGTGQGIRIACRFSKDDLSLKESGLICKKQTTKDGK